jgi:transposase InsO family protein
VDLSKKLEEWERYYNYNRPHGAFQGRTPYKVLKALLQ